LEHGDNPVYPPIGERGNPHGSLLYPPSLLSGPGVLDEEISEASPRSHPTGILGTNPRAMELNALKDLYIHELKDLFSAEQQLVRALPKAAANKDLAGGFQQRLEQTKEHAQR
jgi:hypothetical protein